MGDSHTKSMEMLLSLEEALMDYGTPIFLLIFLLGTIVATLPL
jgi:hypothetical protein